MAMDDFLTQLLNGLGFGEKKSDNQKNGEGDNESDISQFSFDSYQWFALCSGNSFWENIVDSYLHSMFSEEMNKNNIYCLDTILSI